jgi:hypothetical protein
LNNVLMFRHMDTFPDLTQPECYNAASWTTTRTQRLRCRSFDFDYCPANPGTPWPEASGSAAVAAKIPPAVVDQGSKWRSFSQGRGRCIAKSNSKLRHLSAHTTAAHCRV